METNERTPTHAGPSLLGLAVVYTLVFLAALAAIVVLQHGPISTAIRSMNPYAPAADVQGVLGRSPQAVRVGAFLLLGSAIALGLYAATMVSRLRFLGTRMAGPY